MTNARARIRWTLAAVLLTIATAGPVWAGGSWSPRSSDGHGPTLRAAPPREARQQSSATARQRRSYAPARVARPGHDAQSAWLLAASDGDGRLRRRHETRTALSLWRADRSIAVHAMVRVAFRPATGEAVFHDANAPPRRACV